MFFAEINYGKNYQLWKNIPDYRPSTSNKRQLNQTGLLCRKLPIILFQWLINLRAIFKCNQLTFTCTLCHGQDRADAHFFNYRSLCYAFLAVISPEFERSICSINQYLRPYSELCFSLSGGNLGLLLRLSSGNCVIASYLALTHGYVCWRRAYPHKPCFSLAGGNLPRSSES